MLKPVDKRIGIVINNLGPTQLAYYAIKQANKYKDFCDVTIFYENMTVSCLELECSLMSINEIWHYSGNLIATDIETALKINRAAISAKKIFYVYDLEWLRNKVDYLYNLEAFESVKIVARSEEHAKLIEKYSNKKVADIIPDFDIWRMILC